MAVRTGWAPTGGMGGAGMWRWWAGVAWLWCALAAPKWLSGVSGAQTQAEVSSADEMVATARERLNAGRPEEALRLLQAGPEGAAMSAAERGEVEGVRGEALYAEGRWSEAERAFAAALAAGPGDAGLRRARGMALYRMNRPAEAAELLSGAGERTAEESYALVLCYMDTRQYDGARRALAVQYGFAPESARAYLLAARMLFRREYVPVATEFATKALALEPSLPLVHELLGEIALAQQHLPEAEREFEAERRLNPLAGVTYDRLGDTYLRGGEYGKAQKVLRQAMVLEPATTAPYILLGKLLLKQGDAVGALPYLQRAKGMDPHNYMTHSLLGQAYRAEGKTAEAAAELTLAGAIQAESEPHVAQP